MKITILRDTFQEPSTSPGDLAISFQELKGWATSGRIFRQLFRYDEARLLTSRTDTVIRPFLTALLMRLICRGACSFQDDSGAVVQITFLRLMNLVFALIKATLLKPFIFRKIKQDIEHLKETDETKHSLDLTGTVLYLRTDPWFGVRAGGSVGHITGVLNNLDGFCGRPVFITSDAVPTVRQDIESHIISMGEGLWDYPILVNLKYNYIVEKETLSILGTRKPSFIYQRYSLNNFSGVRLSRSLNVPFVLEYNGSEVWIARNWGQPLKHEKVSLAIEMLNLKAADLIVVVSSPMKDELIDRGIDERKILVNPNGVDPDVYSPAVDGATIREQYGLDGKTVVGFIGTFGRWHGAEVLAEAFGLLIKEHPEYRNRARLLMIGDGITMPEVKQNIEKYVISDISTLTGMVPQTEGPAHLAACDVLVASHVPNPDGTPFFGSPTKLFEYMAMGRGIVASDLDQIGEVLDHQKTAWMVRPGDTKDLMHGLKKLIDEKDLRDELGMNARREALEKHTWKEHTRKIVDRLEGLVRKE